MSIFVLTTRTQHSDNFLSEWRCLHGSFTDEELDEQAEQQPQVLHNGSNTVFKVTCGAKCGALHKERFASGKFHLCALLMQITDPSRPI